MKRQDKVMAFVCGDKYTMACVVEGIHKVNKSNSHWGKISYAIDTRNNYSINVIGKLKDLVELKHAIYARHGMHIRSFYDEQKFMKEVSA